MNVNLNVNNLNNLNNLTNLTNLNQNSLNSLDNLNLNNLNNLDLNLNSRGLSLLNQHGMRQTSRSQPCASASMANFHAQGHSLQESPPSSLRLFLPSPTHTAPHRTCLPCDAHPKNPQTLFKFSAVYLLSVSQWEACHIAQLSLMTAVKTKMSNVYN